MSSQTHVQQEAAATGGWLRNPLDNRLRAGWRILAFLAIFYSIALPALFGLRALLGLSKSSPLVIVIIALAATPAVYIARRWIDKKDFVSLGLKSGRHGAADVLFGFVLSGIMMGAVFGAMLALGYISNVEVIELGWPTAGLLVTSLLIMALVSFWEELVFRGYILQNMAEGMGMKTAVLISCVLYGLVHSANPNAGLLSTAIIILFGYLRIYGYLSTGQLWLSMGMHAGWNFFQATVFGFAASGHTEGRTLLTHDALAPDWLSGGDFGPEASVVTIPVVLIALVAMRGWSMTSVRRRSVVSRD
ncbi:MAG: CPBP family intramembrane metalloprotease [Gammaproteobacteria bacterium]|nr:CPBP family intramembrane metalloprotease [Gammaproteobacteria bacterium]MDH3432691.1 CPBP family intramembrane metalloprotease [Gammaproteobacteria bacterium]